MLFFLSEAREPLGSETARVHHAARRSGCLAARSAGATAGEAADHRILGLGHTLSLELLDRCFCAATARTRLDRGSQCRDRVSLGGGTPRKRLEFFREVVTDLRRLAILANVGYAAAVLEMGEAQAAAGSLGLEVITLEVRRAEDIAPAFEALKGRAQALYVVTADPLLITYRIRINTLANIARLPMITTQREFVEAGGLMSYGPNYLDLFHHAADYVDKILRGAKPGDIPVEQPTKFDLVVNLTTARALGLTIPESFLLRADEVIE